MCSTFIGACAPTCIQCINRRPLRKKASLNSKKPLINMCCCMQYNNYMMSMFDLQRATWSSSCANQAVMPLQYVQYSPSLYICALLTTYSDLGQKWSPKSCWSSICWQDVPACIMNWFCTCRETEASIAPNTMQWQTQLQAVPKSHYITIWL